MWKQCSTCKKPIGFSAKYFACSVSTCQARATNFAFCTLDCWDAHVPTFRHKDAWGEERLSPTEAAARAEEPKRIVVSASAATAPAAAGATEAGGEEASTDDVLIVASKLKAYIRAKGGGMNTSQGVLDALSDIVRRRSDAAIERARAAGRKTVMDRDFE